MAARRRTHKKFLTDGWKRLPKAISEKQMQRIYELMFIVRPDMTDEDLDKLISTLETQASTSGATVKNVERMGKRRLAYMVRGFADGMYILFTLEGTGEIIHELERRLRVTEPVIKFLTVRVDEEQKRLDKVKKLRDAKVKTRPAPAMAPATAPVTAPVAAPVAAEPVAPAEAAGDETAPATV
jgi:small subunit ribosomal protein S6